MEKVQNNGAAGEELGENFSSLLSSSIVNKFEKEFEKKGMLLTPEFSGQLRKLVESYNEIQASSLSSLTEDVGTARPIPALEQSAQATLPPLVFQFQNPGNECVMGMMINGKPEVVENEEGSRNTAEKSQWNGGLCQVAILAVSMGTKCKERLRLKEAAYSAGFQDVYLICAEGLAAYYWFHEKGREMERNNYSKDFVMIDLFGHAVVYQKSFESGIDGKKILVVKAVILLNFYLRLPKEIENFDKIIKEQLTISERDTVIPIIRGKEYTIFLSYLADKYGIKAAVAEDDKSDEFKYFAIKGAALLGGNPGNIARQVRNMIGTTVTMGAYSTGLVTRPESLLPETFDRRTWHAKHYCAKYQVSQIGIGVGKDAEMIGYLAINGVKAGAELKVTCELSWEGIWKVVDVLVKNAKDDDEGYTAVKWDWVVGDEPDYDNFECGSYQECKSLLLKILPSPSQAKVGSVGLPDFGDTDTTGGLGISQDQSGGLGRSTADSGDRNEMQEKKGTRKGRVITTTDIIVNTGLKKIKLESDWVEPMLKVEPGLVDDFREDRNGPQVKFEEHEDEIEIEVGVLKIKVEEDEDMTG